MNQKWNCSHDANEFNYDIFQYSIISMTRAVNQSLLALTKAHNSLLSVVKVECQFVYSDKDVSLLKVVDWKTLG